MDKLMVCQRLMLLILILVALQTFLLRNGEPMTTMEETKAAEWSNATVTSSVHEMIEMLGRDKNKKNRMPVGRWAAEDDRKQRIRELADGYCN